MRQIPAPQEIYRHFKGNLYQIVTVAEHSETGEQLVVYQALYGDFRVYARPLSMFMEKTDREKYPEADQQYRFERMIPHGTGMEAEFVQGQEKIKMQEETEERKDQVNGSGSRQNQPEEPGSAQNQPEERGSADNQPEGEAVLDPLVVEFLDASSCEERLNILSALHHRITGEMINIMSIALDIELKPGDIEEQYVEFRSCLALMERFESNRLR